MSHIYTQYDRTTGEIIGTGVVSDDTMALLISEGTPIVVDVNASADTHYVSSGAIVSYTTAELAEKAKVVDGWIWKMPERVAIDTRSLQDLKIAKNDEINSARLAASRKSFTFAGKTIACDELSRSDIDGINGIVTLIQAMPAGWVGGWKASDNTYVSIPDVNTWKTFYGAMVAKGQSNFAHAQDLKAALIAATTPAQIEAITWGV